MEKDKDTRLVNYVLDVTDFLEYLMHEYPDLIDPNTLDSFKQFIEEVASVINKALENIDKRPRLRVIEGGKEDEEF